MYFCLLKNILVTYICNIYLSIFVYNLLHFFLRVFIFNRLDQIINILFSSRLENFIKILIAHLKLKEKNSSLIISIIRIIHKKIFRLC